MQKFEIINPADINDFEKKGYEFVAAFQQPERRQEYVSPKSYSGSLMNNSFNMSESGGNNYKDVIIYVPKFLMKAGPTSQVLFGDKT